MSPGSLVVAGQSNGNGAAGNYIPIRKQERRREGKVSQVDGERLNNTSTFVRLPSSFTYLVLCDEQNMQFNAHSKKCPRRTVHVIGLDLNSPDGRFIELNKRRGCTIFVWQEDSRVLKRDGQEEEGEVKIQDRVRLKM